MKSAVIFALAAAVMANDWTTTPAYTTPYSTSEWEGYSTTTPSYSSEWEGYSTTSSSSEWEVYSTTSSGWEAYTTSSEYTWATYSKPAEATTWETYTKPAEQTTWATYKATSTVPAPVAKYTGAANKGNMVGGAAVGLAAIAFML